LFIITNVVVVDFIEGLYYPSRSFIGTRRGHADCRAFSEPKLGTFSVAADSTVSSRLVQLLIDVQVSAVHITILLLFPHAALSHCPSYA
jgi:hypothetical protein